MQRRDLAPRGRPTGSTHGVDPVSGRGSISLSLSLSLFLESEREREREGAFLSLQSFSVPPLHSFRGGTRVSRLRRWRQTSQSKRARSAASGRSPTTMPATPVCGARSARKSACMARSTALACTHPAPRRAMLAPAFAQGSARRGAAKHGECKRRLAWPRASAESPRSRKFCEIYRLDMYLYNIIKWTSARVARASARVSHTIFHFQPLRHRLSKRLCQGCPGFRAAATTHAVSRPPSDTIFQRRA